MEKQLEQLHSQVEIEKALEIPLPSDKEEQGEVIMSDPIWDGVLNTLILSDNGFTDKIWRWKPTMPEEWIMGESYLNLKDIIRGPVKEDLVEFLAPIDSKRPWRRKYNEAILCEGIGSGKSFKMSVACSYFVHLLLCLKNPQGFFRVGPATKLAIINMCFAGDQLVRRSDGTEVSFKNLFASQEEVDLTAYDVENELFINAKAKPCRESGVQPVFKVTLGNGRVLRLTASHPLLTREKDFKGRYSDKPMWKTVGNLAPGEIVRVGHFVPKCKPSGFTANEIKFLAYLFGDCQITATGVQFITSYRKTATDFKEVCKGFNVPTFKEFDKGDLHCILAESKEIVDFVKRAGVEADEAVRGVPVSILTAPTEEVILFLNRLWATYGSVNIGHKLSINFTNPSEKFIRDMADLLSRFGILTRYYLNNGKFKKELDAGVFRLSISDTESKHIFMAQIGRYGLRLEGCHMIKGNLGRRFEWTHIDSITPDGSEMTYDVEVPIWNNLVVNGIVCHNSVSERNAKAVVFGEIKNLINSSKWFTSRPWDEPEARMPEPNCLSELRFRNNIHVIPGSSSWRSAVGYSPVVGIIDEAGGYRATDNSDQAEDIYLTLQRRLGSRFESLGALIIGGSPMYESDFLERRVTEAEQGKNKHAYVKRRTLWESKYSDWRGDFFYVDSINRVVLPGKPEDMKGVDKIPKVDFLYEAFLANVTKAYRDFGARPSPVLCGFFENPKILLERHDRTRSAPENDPVDRLGRFKDWFKPVAPAAFHAVHVDLAVSGDACGIALGHFDGRTPEGGIKVYIDLMLRIKGSPKNPVDISKVRDYIYSLSTLGFKINIITYDGFQSSDSIQILTRKGYKTELLSVDRTTIPYYDLKEAINGGRLNYYNIPSTDLENPSASEVFVKECMRLEEIEGKKIDHPPKGSKDMADAVCGVVHNIVKNSRRFLATTAKII